MTVDPKVYALAEAFLEDSLRTMSLNLSKKRRDQLSQRVAEAMQRAVESECDAIEQEFSDAAR